MLKTRLVLVALVVSSCALAVAGCGGGGGGSSSSDLASLAPAGSVVYVEGTLRPSGQLKSNVDRIAQTVGGVDDLGKLIVSKLEELAREDGEPFDFERDVEPWLGENMSIFFKRLEDGDLSEPGVVIEATDTDAAQRFIDEHAAASEDPFEDASYEGVDYEFGGSDKQAVGIVGDYFVVGEDKRAFEDAVDASDGDSLADESAYDDAISAAADGSLADVYVDVGSLIEQAGDDVDPQVLQLLKGSGIDPSDATAVASLVPGSDQVEIDISSDLGDQEAPSGDASELLGSLPADSFAAFAVSGFGEQLEEAIDELDASGIPGQIPPHKLKSGAGELGFDLDKIAASLEDAGLFASGSGEGNVGGALVLTSGDSSEVAMAVKTIGALVRQSGTPGVTAVTGKASGFSVRDPEELGPQPLVVATEGDRVAIGYGLRPTLRGLAAGGGSSLADTPDYEAAVSSLGETPIGGFVDGQGALRLADSFVPASETGFEEAKPYLKHIRFIALGSGTEGDRATAKLIVGLGK
jgi:uncharacterized protein DUF3352